MTKENTHTATSQKIVDTFAPINTTDRPVTAHPSGPGHRFGIKKIIASLGFIILIVLVGTFVFNMATRGENSASNEVRSVFSGEEMKEYNSPENKFSILMPGFPSINESTKITDGKETKITTYERIVSNNTKNYTLAVYELPEAPADPARHMETSLNSAMQNTPGAKVSESKSGIYNGLPALEAKYTVPDKDKTAEAHIRYILKDSKMYAVILIGDTQAKFDEFANSLRLS